MTYPDPPIILDVDASGYITGLGQAEKATEGFSGQVRTAALAMGPMRAALDQVTPSRALLAGITGFTLVAGRNEAQLSTLRATAKTTGANFSALTKNTRELAKEFPVSNAGARELVTTMSKMGLATKDNEKSIGSLAKTYTQLGGATGENAAGLAQGLIQLNRATNTGQSPERVAKLADALTTVSAESGASATGVLQFSKAIAPMANASGIGETKILGISAAFSQMGEDGFGAANAFNKMLGDLSRSVREGSPEMSKYAQIVGTSADEFERLFKADPTEAIIRVTEAIGQAGENGPRMLEQLGLEGVRTQRSLQQLSSGGGLRTAVASATEGYGSGSTQEAADVAFGGLADSTQRLANVTEQAADALGTPFLGALSMVTDMLGAGVSGGIKAGGAVTSLPVPVPDFIPLIGQIDSVSDVFKGLTYAALPMLAAFKLVPGLVTALGLRQGLTSGPVRGFLAGVANSGNALSGVAGRLGGNAYNDALAAGQRPGSARMAPINERSRAAGERVGGVLPTSRPGTGGPGFFRQLLGTGAIGAGMYLRTLSEGARQSRIPFPARTESAMRAMDPAVDRFMQERRGLLDQRSAGTIDNRAYRQAIRGLAQETAGAVKPLSLLTRGVAELGRQTVMSTPSLIRGVGAPIAKGAAGLVGAMGGGVGVGIMAVMAGVSMKNRSDEEERTRADQAKNQTSFLDDYRVAMGKATEATSTFSGAVAAAAKSTASAEMTAAQARQVTSDDLRSAATADKDKDQVRDYSGMSVDSATRRIQGGLGGAGAAPDEIQRIQQDLLMSGFNADQVERISGRIPTSTAPAGPATANVTGRVDDISGMERRGGFVGRLSDGFGSAGLSLPVIPGLIDRTQGTIDSLSKKQVAQASELTEEIQGRATQRADTYSPEYAQKMQFEETDAAISEAFANGDRDLAERLMKNFQGDANVSDKNKGRAFSEEDIEAAGGSYTRALARRDKQFNQTFNDQQAVERGEIPGRTATPVLDRGWAAKNLGDNPLAALFDRTGTGQSNRAVTALMGDPESPQLQQRAMQTVMADQREAGSSMLELARNATDAANKLGELDDSTIAFLNALRQAAQMQIQFQAVYRSSSETRQDRAQLAAGDARMNARTRQGREQQQQGVAELAGIRDEAVGSARAQLMARREQQISQQRMEADYTRQRGYAIDDFNRQIERAQEQHQITLFRTERGYLRARERGEEDYQRGRRIAQRDFNKSMARMAEDGARAMYEPYSRISVQPIWDVPNLTGNLEEQNQAIREQIGNLDTLRRAGASNDLITLLGLNDPKNAQQLAEVVASMAEDPAVLRALEAAADQRMALGGTLAKDAANPAFARANEDFATSMADQAEQYRTSMSRGAQDYETALADMNADHARAMEFAAADQGRAMDRMALQQQTTLDRMAEDIARADEELVTDLGGYHELLTQMIDGQILDFRGRTKSTLQGTLDDVRLFNTELEQLIENGGPDIDPPRTTAGATGTRNGRDRRYGDDRRGGGSEDDERRGNDDYTPPTFGAITSGFGPRKAPKTSSGRGSSNHAGVDYGVPIGTAVRAAWPGIVTGASKAGGYGNLLTITHAKGKETRYAHLSAFEVKKGDRVDAGELVARSGNTGNSSGPHLHFETRMNGQAIDPARAVRAWAFAQGGIATEPTQALIAEAGSNEAVIPLNSQGIGALAKALREFVGADDARALRASGGTVINTYDSSVHHSDHSVRVEGPITVQAQDPNEMARKIAAKKRLDALTAPAQRR